MATMASLIVEVGADIQRFVSGMTKVDVHSRNAAKSIKREFGALAAGIGGALAGAGIAMFVKQTIEVQDSLAKMSQKTGVTVADLSALRYAGDLAGAPIESIGKGMKRLSTAMTEAHDPVSKSGQLMRALGVNITGGAMPALKQIADVFQAMPDGTTKAALAVELFGKAGMDMIPLLNQGSAGLALMAEEAARLGIIFDEQTAKSMEQFNDNMKALGYSAEGLVAALTNQLAPGMVRISKAMKQAAQESGVLKALWVGLGGLASEVLGLNDMETEGERRRANMKDIERSQENITKLEAARTALIDAGAAADNRRVIMAERALATAKDMLKVQLLIEAAYAGEFQDQVSRAAGRKPSRGGAVAEADKLATRLQQILSGNSGKVDVGTDLLVRMQQELDTLNLKAGEYNTLAKVKLELEKAAYKLISPEMKKKILAVAAEIDAKKQEIDQVEREKKAREGLGRVFEKIIEDREAELQTVLQFESAMASQLDDLKAEADMYGKSAKEIAKANAARQIELQVRREIAALPRDDMGEPSYDAAKRILESGQRLVAGAHAQIDANYEVARSVSMIEGAWVQASDIAGSFFMQLIDDASSAFDFLKRSLKQLLAELIAVFAKRWVLQMAAGLTGLGSLGDAAANVGQGTISGALANGLSSWFGSTAAGAAFSDLGAGFALGFNGAANMPMAAYAFPQLGSTMGSFGAQLGALAANPITWVVVAAIAAIAIIKSREGGPKQGGSFFGEFDANGNFIGNRSVPGTDNGRFFTPSTQDSAMQQLGTNFATSFFSTISRLGGSAAGMTLGFGTDQDPQGSAANRVMGAIYRDGVAIFRQMIEAGRDDEDLQRGFSLVTSRMMLAGLQQSNLPRGIANILNTVAADTGTEEQIKAVIDLALAFGDLMTVVTAPFTSSGIITAAYRTATDALDDQGKALVELAGKSSLTVEELQQLTQATIEYRNAAAQLIVALESLRRSIADMFSDLIEDTRIAGMDPQQQFDYWQQQANWAYNMAMNATDPAEIERYMGQFTRAWRNAWALLSPEEQASQSATWAERLESLAGKMDVHLREAIAGVTATANAVLTTVGDKMNEASDKLVNAATKFDDASTKFAGTVDRGIKVSIIVDQYGSAIVTDTGG